MGMTHFQVTEVSSVSIKKYYFTDISLATTEEFARFTHGQVLAK